jgi:hypothetical protein
MTDSDVDERCAYYQSECDRIGDERAWQCQVAITAPCGNEETSPFGEGHEYDENDPRCANLMAQCQSAGNDPTNPACITSKQLGCKELTPDDGPHGNCEDLRVACKNGSMDACNLWGKYCDNDTAFTTDDLPVSTDPIDRMIKKKIEGKRRFSVPEIIIAVLGGLIVTILLVGIMYHYRVFIVQQFKSFVGGDIADLQVGYIVEKVTIDTKGGNSITLDVNEVVTLRKVAYIFFESIKGSSYVKVVKAIIEPEESNTGQLRRFLDFLFQSKIRFTNIRKLRDHVFPQTETDNVNLAANLIVEKLGLVMNTAETKQLRKTLMDMPESIESTEMVGGSSEYSGPQTTQRLTERTQRTQRPERTQPRPERTEKRVERVDQARTTKTTKAGEASDSA